MAWRLIDDISKEIKMVKPACLTFKSEGILHAAGGIMVLKLSVESMPKPGHINILSIKLCLAFLFYHLT